MDQTYLLGLTLAVVVALGSIGMIRRRSEAGAHPGTAESPFAVSTEGMKTCPKCGMGSMWTQRKCSACGTALRG